MMFFWKNWRTIMSGNEYNVEERASSNSAKLELDFLFKPLNFEKMPIDPVQNQKVPGIVCDENENIYSFSARRSKLWKLNITANTWTKLPTTGTPFSRLLWSSFLIHEDRLIVFGGCTAWTDFTNEVRVCDLEVLHWHQIVTTGPAPAPRCGSTMIVYNKNLYIIGGMDELGILCDVHKMNLDTSTWETLWTADGSESKNGQEPDGVVGHKVVVHGDKIILFGMKNYLGTNNLNKIPAFDLKTRAWTCLDTTGDSSQSSSTATIFPSSAGCFSVMLKGQEAFICGATAPDGIWKINLIDLKWTKLQIIYPHESSLMNAVLSPSGYLLGFIAIGRKTRVWKCWLGVPSLKEMVWSCLQPNLKNKSKDLLIESGIPRDLISRLDT